MKKKPLVIFYGYQEIHNASAQIARTFWEHVSREEFDPTIICALHDENFHSVNNIISVEENSITRLFFRILRRLKLKDFTMIPDIEFFSWNYRAFRKAKKLLRTGDYDYIHTIASPMSSHLIGVKLKRRAGIPLVIQCNDPWHDTSGRNYRFQWCANRDLYYERVAAENADVIIHSNSVITEIWNERYGEVIASKIHVVPFSFNIYKLPKIGGLRKVGKKLNISHIGNVYSSRSSITIFKGIESLLNEHPEVKDKFFIRFIGEVHQNEKEYVKEHNLASYVEYLGSKSPDDLAKYYLEADMFLIIDVVIKRNPNYPSKLMLYYYYRKPIVALTTPNSNIETELTKSGHSVCYYNDYKSVQDVLYKAITDYDSLLHFNQDEWKKHTIESVAYIYTSLIDALSL